MRCCSRTSAVLILHSIGGSRTSAAGLFASAEQSGEFLAQYDDPLAAIEAAEQILVLDRRHEAAWRALIRCHAERGDIRAAVAAYDRCRGTLAETADARPSPETEELIGRIRSQSTQSAQRPGMRSEGAPVPIAPPPGRRPSATAGHCACVSCRCGPSGRNVTTGLELVSRRRFPLAFRGFAGSPVCRPRSGLPERPPASSGATSC